ncbi:carbamate kinase [Myxococcota bacterium]|nr:carbamate kinase [Myxococcota bacterium]MBU1430100.1 carbamate kinase [Myxococcota bacterium]MBU1896842.1 carbamate kinase [Myxococcota bacterium]
MPNLPQDLTVVAMGGHSLLDPQKAPSVESQFQVTAAALAPVVTLINRGVPVVLTHGNGPQVGFLKRRVELAMAELHDVPLDALVADTQGALGYMIQRELRLLLKDPTHPVATLVTEVEVDPEDPAFSQPTKGIGSFYSHEEGQRLQAEYGWVMVEDSGRGWRRVVPSPRPQRIIQLETIKALLDAGVAVIACGGGGIPVAPDAKGDLMGLEAVIDKDLSSALLANDLGARTLLITTGVRTVFKGFRGGQPTPLHHIGVDEARALLDAGEFPAGSMGPKIQAAIEFLDRGGERVIICHPSDLAAAFDGQAGTTITKEPV